MFNWSSGSVLEAIEINAVRTIPFFRTLPSLDSWTDFHRFYVKMLIVVWLFVYTLNPNFESFPFDGAPAKGLKKIVQLLKKVKISCQNNAD